MGVLGFDRIRLAVPEDEDRVYEFLKGLHRENGIFPVSESKSRNAIRHATDRKGGVIGIIDGVDGSIEACIGLVLESWWYTQAPSLNERWNYVREDCRRTTHAKQMIEFAKRCADELGVPLIMGIITNEKTEAKVRLYRRQMQHVGGFFMYGANWPKSE